MRSSLLKGENLWLRKSRDITNLCKTAFWGNWPHPPPENRRQNRWFYLERHSRDPIRRLSRFQLPFRTSAKRLCWYFRLWHCGIGQKTEADNIPHCNDTHFASCHWRRSALKPHRLRRFRYSIFHHYGSCASATHRQSFRAIANLRKQYHNKSKRYQADLS